jgi:hypothetical protein
LDVKSVVLDMGSLISFIEKIKEEVEKSQSIEVCGVKIFR